MSTPATLPTWAPSSRAHLFAFLLTVSAYAPMLAQHSLEVNSLRVEYLTNPLGTDAALPRLSWRLASSERNTVQAAYQLQAAGSEEDLSRESNLLWDSGKIFSDSSVFVRYGGPPLLSRTRYFWRVRVWNASGGASSWSPIAYWETGLLRSVDWTAKWIGPRWIPADSLASPSPLLRRPFQVRGSVHSARLYVTSLGLYEVFLNGKRVGDLLLTPGWTSYHRRLEYQTYDVTSFLQSGENAVGAMLGDGWYRGYLGFSDRRNVYGRRLALLAQLEILYKDGRRQLVVSDESWKTTRGPILSSDIYRGETYDARRERVGWTSSPYDDRGWQKVEVLDPPQAALVAAVSQPVRRVSEVRPLKVWKSPSGEMLFDLGQNFSGWVRLRIQGDAGHTVVLRYAEVLAQDGNLYTANLRRAAQTDMYILKGGGKEEYEPHFTFHGFRFVGVMGLLDSPDASTITGVVVSSNLEQTGSLVTSDSLLNRLQRNIVWGQRSNFIHVPTDCPQRDERLGWTGDAQVFARTAAFNMDVDGFFAKWLADLAADQHASGSVPWVVPNALGGDSIHSAGTAGWADAAVIVPWTMYLAYGDRDLLRRQYSSMCAWVEYARRQAGPDLIWRPGWQFGDWLALHTDDPSYPGATTGTDLIATAFLAYSADLLGRAAAVLEQHADAGVYHTLFNRVRDAFNHEFVSPAGRVGENTQTAYVLALAFHLLPDSLTSISATRLVQDIRAHDHHLTTGFLGTSNLLHVLSENGYPLVAYDLLTQRTYPSWLYPLSMGATTMWERWDGIRPDTSFQNPEMNSFNHYAFGAVGDWMYRNIGGIDVDSTGPGYRKIRIAPRIGAGLTRASASLETRYGRIASSWRIDGMRFVLDVTVPANTSAVVTLWNTKIERAHEGDLPLDGTVPGVRDVRQRGDDVIVEVGSGQYSFVSTASP